VSIPGSDRPKHTDVHDNGVEDETRFVSTVSDDFQARTDAAEAAARAALGTEKYDEMIARGARIELAEAVAYLRVECAHALAAHPTAT
jgi:hypothetical protein